MNLFLISFIFTLAFLISVPLASGVESDVLFEFGSPLLDNDLDFALSSMVVDGNDQIIAFGSDARAISIFDSNGNHINSINLLDVWYDHNGDVVVDSSDQIILSSGNHIYIFDSDGFLLDSFNLIGSNDKEIFSITEMTIDSSDRIILGGYDNIIRIFDSAGNYIDDLILDGSSDSIAALETIFDIATDSSDRIIVTSKDYSRTISIFDSDGNFVNSFNRIVSDDDEFVYSMFVAVDSSDRIILAYEPYENTSNIQRIQIFDSNGSFINSFDIQGYRIGELAHITIDQNDQLLISDDFNPQIRIFDLSGNFVDRIGKSYFDDGQLLVPTSFTMNNFNQFVVIDDNHRMQIFDSDGNYVDKIEISEGSGDDQLSFHKYFDDDKVPPLRYNLDIAIDSSDRIFVADQSNRRIQIFDSDGNFVNTIDGPNTLSNRLNPFTIAIDSSDRLILHNADSHKIHVFDSSGNSIDEFDTPIYTLRNFDHYIAIDSSDRIILGSSNGVEIFDSSGNHLKTVGSFGFDDGQFLSVKNIAIDSSDQIIVVDNDKIEILNSDGNFVSRIQISDLDYLPFSIDDIFIDDNRIIALDSYSGKIIILESFNNIDSESVSFEPINAEPINPAHVDVINPFDVESSNYVDNYPLAISNPHITNNVGESVSFLVDPSYDYVSLNFDVVNTGTEPQTFAYGYEHYWNDQYFNSQWINVETIDPDSTLPFSRGLSVPHVGLYDTKIVIWDNVENHNIIDDHSLTFEIKNSPVLDESSSNETESTLSDTVTKPILEFVDSDKDPQYYIDRYNNEPSYQEWFDVNYPDYTIEEAVGYEKIMSKVPSWVKNNAEWWVDGSLEDADFAAGIQHLVKEKIINVSVTVSTKPILEFVDSDKDPQYYIDRYNNEPSYREWFDSNYPDYTIEEGIGFTSNEIPSWVKNNAEWWADGLLSEDDFLTGVEYLIEEGIIRVS